MAPAQPKRQIQRCPKGALYLETESKTPGGRGTWYARVPSEHTIEDVLSPEYFGLHIGERGVRGGDRIEIEPANALWLVHARIMGTAPPMQQVFLREIAKMRENYEVKPQPGYRFEWDGNDAHWVIWKGEVKVDMGLATQDECYARVEELMREKRVA
jgi:hypothetical protein